MDMNKCCNVLNNVVLDEYGISFSELPTMSEAVLMPEYKDRIEVCEGAYNLVSLTGNNISACYINENGNTALHDLIPDIVNVEVLKDNNKDVGVKIEFNDGTFTKSVIAGDDKFDLEMGISICITKKMLDMHTNGNGSSVYNKLVDYAVKVMKQNQIAGEQYEKDRAEKKRIYENKCRKKKRRREKREAQLREREIEIQKEAYLRAMRELNNNT